jgi:hypothetical protein
LTATGLDANFWPTPNAVRDRFVLVCGLIARERVSINKAVDDLSLMKKDHLFIVLEEKLDYPANLEESVRKKAVEAAISHIGTLQRRFKTHLREKYLSEEETPFVKHAFLQQQDWDMFVQETNSPSFQQLSQEMKQKTGRKGYRGKRKEWEEEDANLAAEGKQNPWDQFPGRSRPYLWGKGREEEEEY